MPCQAALQGVPAPGRPAVEELPLRRPVTCIPLARLGFTWTSWGGEDPSPSLLPPLLSTPAPVCPFIRVGQPPRHRLHRGRNRRRQFTCISWRGRWRAVCRASRRPPARSEGQVARIHHPAARRRWWGAPPRSRWWCAARRATVGPRRVADGAWRRRQRRRRSGAATRVTARLCAGHCRHILAPVAVALRRR